MTWNTMDSIPHDRPVMLARWCSASDYNRDGIKEAHWTYYDIFKWQEAPEHDRSVVCVSLDRQSWLRGGTTVSGKNSLEMYRWADIPALPDQPANW